MKTIKTIAVLALMGTVLLSCDTETIRASDEISTRSYDFSGVTALEVATGFQAYIMFSDTEERFSIEANDNLFEKIRIYQEGRKLVVRLKNNVNVRGRETLNLYVTVNRMTDFKASSDASITLDDALVEDEVFVDLSSDAFFEGDINSDRFELRGSSDSKAVLNLEAQNAYLDLSSGADLDGEASFGNAVVELSSDATINLAGNTDDLQAELSSDSQLKGYELEVRDLKITLSSDSESYLTVSNTIDVRATSDGALFYKGNAEVIRQALSSGGRLVKKD